MSVRRVIIAALAAALIGVVLAEPAAAVSNGSTQSSATCDSAWWTSTSPTQTTFVPTKNGTGDADCILGQGSQGWGVVALQNVLRKCYGQNIQLDGVYGPATANAVKNAQAWENAVRGAGLAVDGVYGNKTRIAITWPLYASTGNLDAAETCHYVSWG